MIFFTSDPHYGHRRVIDYENRPFQSVDEMDESMIQNHNSIVQPSDTVIYLGDVFLCSKERARSIMARLNGQKVLILGNHDQSMPKMMRLGFVWACYEMKIVIAGYPVVLSHFPYRSAESSEIDSQRRNPKNEGLWLLHGHVHSKRPRFTGRTINACVDVWDFTPIPYAAIESHIQKTEAAISKKHD